MKWESTTQVLPAEMTLKILNVANNCSFVFKETQQAVMIESQGGT